MNANEVLMPGETLGLMGGGQLGRMFAQAAATMGYHVAVLEPGKACPAGEVSREQIETKYDDVAGLAALAGRVKAVTTEFENGDVVAHRRGGLGEHAAELAAAHQAERFARHQHFIGVHMTEFPR